MRLFIAVNFPENVLDQLEKVVLNLRKGCQSGSFSPRNNFHLTLAFLGEIPEDRVCDIQAAMERVKSEVLDMTISSFGKFRNPGRGDGDTYWMGIKNSPELNALQAGLSDELRCRGFALEKREFRPHLTLGRRVVLSENFPLERFQKSLPEIEVPVRAISLMRSDRWERGVKYTEMYSVSL